jgi:hypothetical protein
MLKITEQKATQEIILKLEGRIIGPWVNELRTLGELLLRNGKGLKLELTEIEFADRDGVELLWKLRGGGAKLEGCSAFLEEQLRTAGVQGS